MLDGSIHWFLKNRNLSSIIEIEELSYGDYAWDRDRILSQLRQYNCMCIVFTRQNKTLGYVIYELASKIEIVKLAVHPLNRRKKIGSCLIKRMIEKLHVVRKRDELLYQIRESNLPGQLFLKKNGFKATQIIPYHFYNSNDGTEEDAYSMSYKVERNSCLTV